MDKIKITWDPKARNSFKKYLSRIKKDSLQTAKSVREDVLVTVGELANHPKMFPPDRFKKDNDGNFRAFEKHSCRVAYFITKSQIRILRVRHMKQEPKEY